MTRFLRCMAVAALVLAVPHAPTAQSTAPSSRFDQWVQRFTDDTMRVLTDAAAARRYFRTSDPRFEEAIEGQIQPRGAAQRARAHALVDRGLAELKAFDPAKLTESQRVAASIIRWDLDTQVEGRSFEDYSFPFTQNDGAQTGLVSLLTVNHPMSTPRDARNYLARLRLLAPRMDETIGEARRIAAKKLVPPTFILEAVAQQIRTFVAIPPGQNPLVTTFADKTAQLKDLVPAQREEMRQAVEQIVSTEVYPAWKRALTLIESEIPQSTRDAGLWRFPNGAAAYDVALKRFTTTKLTANEIHELGVKLVSDIEGRMDVILRQLGYTEGTVRARMDKVRADQPRFPDTAEGRQQYQAFNAEIIADAERRAATLFDRVPKMRVVAQPYPEFMGPRAQSYSLGATDGSRPGTFQYPVVGVPLTRFGVRTIAYHEAIPGHHFQIALQAEDTSLPGFLQHRVFGGNSAVSEGWGLYAEQVAAEQGWYEGDPVGLLGQLDADVFRARRLVVDTGIHAKRWTREQAIEYLGPNPAGSAVSEVERYIARPGQACSYMIGKLKILELRERATKALGSGFSLSEFHNRILGAGPVPLDVLDAAIDRWIASKKAPQAGQGRQGGGRASVAKPYTTWRSYAGGAHSSQYSALDQINRGNVAKLQVAWSVPITGNSIFNPVIVDGVMYAPVGGGALAAIDAATGKELWRKEGVAPSGARGMNYWESADRSDRRFIYLQRGDVIAVNAQNGELITSFGTNGRVDLREAMERKPSAPAPVTTSNPGRIFENLFIIPLPGGASYGGPPSDVHAYDVRTGKLAWIFHVIPHEGEFGADTWPEGHWRLGGGGHNWSEFTIDEENGIAFVGFGSPRYDFYGGDRKGNNLFANSLVAIDARTGKRLWHHQLIHHDLWDWDIPQSAKLLTIRQNGRARQVVAQATKQGFLYVFDRKTGQPIWPIEERPVPQTNVPGEWTSPTQPFPTRPAPFAKQSFTEKDINPYLPKEAQDDVRARLRSYRNDGLFTPPSFEGSVQMPGHNGGANFGTSAVDPDRGEFYVVHKSLPTVIRLALPGTGRGGGPAIVTPEQKAELMAKAKALVDEAKGAQVQFTSPVSFMQIAFAGGAMTAAAPPWSEMVKYNLNTGDIVWRIPTGVQAAPPEYNIPNNTGAQFPRNAPLVTAGGLIFLAVGPERKVHAYDRETGKELWQHSLPNGAEGMPATYEVNGRQFVVLPVAQANGTFPMTFDMPGAAPSGPPAGGGRQGRGGGGPSLPGAYIAFALPQ